MITQAQIDAYYAYNDSLIKAVKEQVSNMAKEEMKKPSVPVKPTKEQKDIFKNSFERSFGK